MRIFNRLLFLLVSFVFLFTTVTSVFAQKAPTPTPLQVTEVEYEKVNPDGGFGYIFKRLEEKVKLVYLSLSPKSKEVFYRELAQRRFAELKYVVEKPDMGNFEKTTIRYSTTIGDWTEFILEKKMDDRKEQAIMALKEQLPVVEQLMTKYDGTTAEWRFVKQDADYIRIYVSKLQS